MFVSFSFLYLYHCLHTGFLFWEGTFTSFGCFVCVIFFVDFFSIIWCLGAQVLQRDVSIGLVLECGCKHWYTETYSAIQAGRQGGAGKT